jgi:hypothetical protein
MTEEVIGRCDVCSKVATVLARDLREVSPGFSGENRLYGSNNRVFTYGDVGRRGCPKHPPVTVCYNLDGSIAVSEPAGFERDPARPSLMAPQSIPWQPPKTADPGRT